MSEEQYYSQFFPLGKMQGVYRVKGVQGVEIATKNLIPGQTFYGERLFDTEYGELREFSHNRSKLASSILSGLRLTELGPNTDVLYLGASFGTTPSHVSDLLSGTGIQFAVEFAPRPMRDFLNVVNQRNNIIPILGDARFPESYSEMVHAVDFLYCDVAQASQSELFIKNAEYFLKSKGTAFIAIKAKSISQVRKPWEVFEEQKAYLEDHGMNVIDEIDINRYHRDHRVFVGKWY